MTIHTFEERAPIPTFMKKIPVCLTYAFCEAESEEGEEEDIIVFTDPTNLEERVSHLTCN